MFGDRVREARQRVRTPGGARLTQGDLAIAVGVERNTVSRWENSGVRPKDPHVVRRLAAALRVPMEWLFEDDGADVPESWTGSEREVRGSAAVREGMAPRSPSMALSLTPYGTLYPAPGASADALGQRISPMAYAVIHDYLARLEQAGVTPDDAAEAGRLLVHSACHRLRPGDPRTRAIDVVLADIEAMWSFVTSVLRAEGREV
jgi:transcriptional regulator with XRE-family HTH domain